MARTYAPDQYLYFEDPDSKYALKPVAPNLSDRLRFDSERHGEDAPTNNRDERSPVHYWMISSARTSSDCGIVSPNAFAVFKFTVR